MKIEVKSIPENWAKEKDNRKCNTIRVLDGNDIIENYNSQTGESFVRQITDITIWNGQIIISWNKLEGNRNEKEE